MDYRRAREKRKIQKDKRQNGRNQDHKDKKRLKTVSMYRCEMETDTEQQLFQRVVFLWRLFFSIKTFVGLTRIEDTEIVTLRLRNRQNLETSTTESLSATTEVVSFKKAPIFFGQLGSTWRQRLAWHSL